ncbi:MAG: zinc ribbon domain-containing protein [Silvanigrellaceae bacterium]|nr:zinc ribbon domain-containing protein [Silvanigrellaceae bacterium]
MFKKTFLQEGFTMPIYEFKCQTCGNIDEHFMRVSDPAPSQCTKCGRAVEKIISQSSFSLKGSGWYVTDYKKSVPTTQSSDSVGSPQAPESSPAPTANSVQSNEGKENKEQAKKSEINLTE